MLSRTGHGGRYLARGARPQVLEGGPSHNMLIMNSKTPKPPAAGTPRRNIRPRRRCGRDTCAIEEIEGGVRRSGNRVRITTQLIDVKTDAHLWAERYDRVLEDVFAIQDEITMCVVGAIEPSLWKAEIDRIKRQRPKNLNAYDLVLRSLPWVLSHLRKDSEVAIPLLQNALELQPDYAEAHAFLSRCLHHRFARAGRHEKDRMAAIQHACAAITHGSDDATALAAGGPRHRVR